MTVGDRLMLMKRRMSNGDNRPQPCASPPEPSSNVLKADDLLSRPDLIKRTSLDIRDPPVPRLIIIVTRKTAESEADQRHIQRRVANTPA